MITSNILIQPQETQNIENALSISTLTAEYNEGDSITTSTAINCIKL